MKKKHMKEKSKYIYIKKLRLNQTVIAVPKKRKKLPPFFFNNEEKSLSNKSPNNNFSNKLPSDMTSKKNGDNEFFQEIDMFEKDDEDDSKIKMNKFISIQDEDNE